MTVSKDKKEILSASPSNSDSPQMKLAGFQTTGQQQIGSSVDPLFINWMPKKIQEQKHLVKIIKNVYQWNITRNGQTVAIWTVDMKNDDGSVYAGPPKGANADAIITLDEKEALDLFEGKLEPAKAFVQGKFKISGNLMAAHKFQQFWSEELSKGTGESVKEFFQQIGNGSNVPVVASIEPSQGVTMNDQALLESIPNSGLKCDMAFNVIRSRMHEEPELIKTHRFIIQFNITKNGKPASTWTVDTKTEGGRIIRGPAEANKADATVTVDDEVCSDMFFDKLNPQRAFMTGKVHVKGNVLLLQRLYMLYNQIKSSRTDPELPLVIEIASGKPLIPGLRSEFIIFELLQRLVRIPKLCTQNVIYEFDIIKDGKKASVWTLKFSPTNEFGIFSRGPPQSGQANCILAIDDDDFVRLTYNVLKLEDAINKGRVKVSGDKNLVGTIDKLFRAPIIASKL